MWFLWWFLVLLPTLFLFLPARLIPSFGFLFLFDFLPVLSLDYLIKELLPTPVVWLSHLGSVCILSQLVETGASHKCASWDVALEMSGIALATGLQVNRGRMFVLLSKGHVQQSVCSRGHWLQSGLGNFVMYSKQTRSKHSTTETYMVMFIN